MLTLIRTAACIALLFSIASEANAENSIQWHKKVLKRCVAALSADPAPGRKTISTACRCYLMPLTSSFHHIAKKNPGSAEATRIKELRDNDFLTAALAPPINKIEEIAQKCFTSRGIDLASVPRGGGRLETAELKKPKAADARKPLGSPRAQFDDWTKGEWLNVGVYEKRSNVFRPGVDIEARREYYRFTWTQGRPSVRKFGLSGSPLKPAVALRLQKAKKTFPVLLERNTRQNAALFPPMRVRHLRSLGEIDVLTNDKAFRLVRLRPSATSPLREPQRSSISAFCGDVANPLATAALNELRAEERTASDARQLGVKRSRISVAASAIFGSKKFAALIGKPVEALGSKEIGNILQRFRICAALYPKDPAATALGGSLLSDVKSKSLRGFWKMRDKTFRDPDITIKTTPDEIKRDVELSRSRLAEFSRVRNRINQMVGASDAQLQKVISEAKPLLRDVPPSQAEASIKRLATAIRTNKERERKRIEAERERTGPPLSEAQLITDATSKYMLADCNRAAAMLRSIKRAPDAMLAILTARSFERIDGYCVVENATHIFSIRVSTTTNHSCKGALTKACEYSIFWDCSFRLNPKFGFAPSTKNIDTICPLVRLAPVPARGRFQPASKRRWEPLAIEWD